MFIVATSNVVFVEPSDRVKDLISQHKLFYDIEIILRRKSRDLNIIYMKTIKYVYDGDNNIVIIDNEFSEMFSTAFVKINNLPEVFVARLDIYKLIVYLLYKQLKFAYDEKELVISKFRRDVFHRISILSEGHFERYL